MSRYVVDFDGDRNDCSFCPMFDRHTNDMAYCNAVRGNVDHCEIAGELRDEGGHAPIMCFDRPDWCPLTPYADNAAAPYVNHGDHGPEPRFEGDAWTAWYCCGNCDHPISPGDNFCHECGARIEWERK